MSNVKTNKDHTFIALTSLWAFVESGLGGMMHAFHLPFTGLFLGGFSVLILSLIATFEKPVFKQLLKATLIVMTVKFSVNPATSPFAYLAVGFQGLLAALIYSLPSRNMFFCSLFAMLAMLESAFQKLLILTVFLGKSWIKALDIYYQSICKTFAIESDAPFGMYVVGFYLLIYVLWGFLLGIWVYQLPLQVKKRLHLYKDLKPDISITKKSPTKKRIKKSWVLAILAIALFVASFFISNASPISATILLLIRTTLIVSIWIFVFSPLFRIWMQKKLNANKQVEMPQILTFIPQISALVKPLYQVVSKQYNGFRKWKEFVLGLIVISLNIDGL